MQIKQVGSVRRGAQSGFTLIELIVVIVILGILAATALPKFTSMGGDARMAKMNAAAGSIRSAAAMYHGRWLAAGSKTGGDTYDGIVVNATGYPDKDSILTAAGILSTDYVTTATPVITVDSTHTACKLTYDPATGTVSVSVSESDCK